MPENLDSYGADDTQGNMFEEVDFEEIDEKLGQEMDNGNAKPLFKTNTNAVIKSVNIVRGINPKKDSKGKEYYDMILKITCAVKQGDQLVETIDNYGGLREYSDGFWSGNKSAFGKLKLKMRDEFGVKTWKDMIRTLSNKEVKIKTENSEFQGEMYQKNIIQSFR